MKPSTNDKIAALAFDPSAPEGEAIAAFLKLRARGVAAKDVEKHTKEEVVSSEPPVIVKVPDTKLRKFLETLEVHAPKARAEIMLGMAKDDDKVILHIKGASKFLIAVVVDAISPRKVKYDIYADLYKEFQKYWNKAYGDNNYKKSSWSKVKYDKYDSYYDWPDDKY